jgi:type I restriction enzyme S subunit
MKWPHVKIKQVAEVASGFGFPREHQGSLLEQYPFFKVGDMNLPGNERCMHQFSNTISAETLKKLKASTFPQGTVIFPKIGAAIATNKKRVLVKPSVVDNNIMGLIPNQHINEWYLYYWMQQFDLRTVSNMGPVPSMRKTEVENLLIPLPPPSEQRKIVEIMDQIDALCKKRAEADAKAEHTLPALFYKMFGDPTMNSKGLTTVAIEELVEPVNRRNPSENPNSTFKYIDIAGVDGTAGRIAECKEMLGIEAPSRARQIIKMNDVLISTVRPYLRATALVPSEFDNEICSTGFCVLRARKGKGYGYLYALSRLPWFTASLNAMARGVSYPAVTDNDILGLYVRYPKDDKSIEQFDLRVKQVLEIQGKRMLSREALMRLFSALLHQAFAGDLTAKWREAHMREVLVEMDEQAKILKASAETERM